MHEKTALGCHKCQINRDFEKNEQHLNIEL